MTTFPAPALQANAQSSGCCCQYCIRFLASENYAHPPCFYTTSVLLVRLLGFSLDICACLAFDASFLFLPPAVLRIAVIPTVASAQYYGDSSRL